MLHFVVTMGQANERGFSRRKVYRLVQREEWVQLHEHVFLTNPGLTDDLRWKAELAGLLLRCGPTAFVSHGAAAVLHQLEGVTDRPLDITVISDSNRFPKTVHRSRFADPNIVVIDGLAASSSARTLRDIAARYSIDVVEQAVESALRGNDRRQPEIWNTALLTELRTIVAEQPRATGNYLLRQVLSRRSDLDRPTGSFPETLLVQALRTLGLHAVRQVTLRIYDANGVLLDIFYPDLSLPGCRLLIEVDGGAAHANERALARDLRRQNKLLRGFRLLRFTAVEIMRNPLAVAQQIEPRSVNLWRSRPTAGRSTACRSVTRRTNSS